MQEINSEADLRSAIIQLQNKLDDEGKILKQRLHLAYDSIKPINIIKTTFKEATASRELRNNVLNTAVGLAAGYLSKLLFVGASKSSLKSVFGTALMFGITNIVAKNPQAVKSLGKSILKIIRSRSADEGVHSVSHNGVREHTS